MINEGTKEVLIFIFLVFFITIIVVFLPSFMGNSFLKENAHVATLILSVIPLLVASMVEKKFNFKRVLKEKLSGVYLVFFFIVFILLCLSLSFEVVGSILEMVAPLGFLISFYLLTIQNEILIGKFNLKEFIKWGGIFLIIKNIQMSGLAVGFCFLENDWINLWINFKDLLYSLFTANIAVITFGLLQVLTFLFFTIGEEYGWRYFLQPRLQKSIGKRKGVLLTGFIWGVWHVPLYSHLFYQGFEAVNAGISITVFCISFGIFLGLLYMKTDSVLMVAMIHAMNNVFMANLGSGESPASEFVFSKEFLMVSLIASVVVYFPFLLAKEYSKNQV